MLESIGRWPVTTAAAAVVRPGGVVETAGDVHAVFELASVTKPLVALATLIAVEEGTVTLDDPLDPAIAGHGVTLRHLLAHASGLPFEGDTPVANPGARRIYSNTGFTRIATVVEAAAQMPMTEYLAEAVCAPLRMTATRLVGGAAAGAVSSVDDLCRFAAELLAPTLVSQDSLDEFGRVQFPGLAGVVPGIGRFDPCDWGLGVELKGAKRPHWMGTLNSPATFGHFGGSGTFLWVDVGAPVSVVALTDRPFATWADEALRLWPALSDDVLAEMSRGRAG
ncbi:MAG: serine hydrolase domain-containing protein [Ilumatobacteraceae bacterium]